MKKVGAGSHFIMILEPADIRQKEVVAASLPRHSTPRGGVKWRRKAASTLSGHSAKRMGGKLIRFEESYDIELLAPFSSWWQ
jgi:hypothetical protein